MSDWSAFYPTGDAVTVSASTTSAEKQFMTVAGRPFRTVRVCNTTTGWAYVEFGASSSVTAVATSSQPVAPNSASVFRVDQGNTFAAAILATGTGNIIFTPGDGGR
jgi:hypothetical protein